MSVTDRERGPASADKGLKAGALGLLSSVVVGVASNPPVANPSTKPELIFIPVQR